jgi:S-adenosylmethionine decarboxylase proenzyme
MEGIAMQALGRQILIELYQCDPEVLNSEERIRDILVEATRRSGATIVSHTFHTFSPHGVSGVVVIAESHVAIHTWPEYGYAAVDVFTCGERIDPWTIAEYLQQELHARSSSCMELKRGLFREPVSHKPLAAETLAAAP